MSYCMGRLGFGFAKSGKGVGGAASTPAWLPLADGTAPKLYADFAAQNYWYNGATVADWATFLSTLSGTLDGSSSRYYTNVAGTLVATTGPRFDYDPVTHVARGILLEGARTNVVQQSATFDNAYWGKTAATITADVAASPDGTTTADRLSPNVGLGSHAVYPSAGFTATAASWALSVYAKSDGGQWININDGVVVNTGVYFDVINGVVGTATAGFTGSITSIGAGWYRLSVVKTLTAATYYIQIEPHSANSENAGWVSAAGAEKFFIWGAQAEAGAFASSYIPTTSGSVTRAADSLVFTPISWFNAAAGTIYSKGQRIFGLTTSPNAAPRMVDIDDGTTSNSIRVGSVQTGPYEFFGVRDSGADQAAITLGTGIAANTDIKIAGAYAANDFAASLGGAAVVTDASGSIPTVTKLTIGNRNANSGDLPWFGTISKFGYWNARVSNAGLVTLST